MSREIGRRGLTAIIAIHDTTLGPALGGVRMWPYADRDQAMRDVLNLSRDMTFKAAVAGLPLGGGKAVIIGDPSVDKTEELFRDFGEFVESLNGTYIASEDAGTEVDDLDIVCEETSYVAGTGKARGGLGDPSPMTALGVFYGMQACLKFLSGTDSFSERRIAVQGAGKVGRPLVEMLAGQGADVMVTDMDEDRAVALARAFGGKICPPDLIYDQECNFFVPCALSGVINTDSIARLRCRVIAGAANNQLASPELADRIHGRGILYVPDFVINAGGLIQVAGEYFGMDMAHVEREVSQVGQRVADLLSLSDDSSETPLEVAVRMVEEIL